MSAERLLSELPKHPLPEGAPAPALRVEGLVREPLTLTVGDLSHLPQTALTEDFACREGWRVPDQAWSGVAVAALLDAAGVQDEGGWVEFAAGDFRFSAPIEEARRGIVALDLNGSPLTRRHGGPARLLMPGADCFTSIKWLDRIEVRADEGANRAAEIALGRIAAIRARVPAPKPR